MKIKSILSQLRNTHSTWRDSIDRCKEAADVIETLDRELDISIKTSTFQDGTIIELKNQLSKWVNVFGHLGEPDAVGNEWHKQRMAASDLETALETIIKYNEEYCVDKYGDASKAEDMACVKVARKALADYNLSLI